jgi:hypothetical protein
MVRRAGPRQVLLVMVAVMAASVLAGLRLAAPADAVACRPAPVSFERVVERATRVFLVTVASRTTAGGAPDTYTLVVREALRGAMPESVTLPTVITIAAPVISGCGDLLDVGITTHLVLALDVPAFDAGDPITVPWIVKPDGSLVGGWDDGPPGWVDLVAFRAALAGEAFATPAPTRDPGPGSGLEDEPPLASVGILAGIIVGVAVALGIVWLARRGSRPVVRHDDGGSGGMGGSAG